MSILLKSAAWLLAAAVTFATLGPPRYRPHAALGQDGEHALAFVLIGLAFGLAYPTQRRLTFAIAIAAIALLEVLQLLAPGRHARLEDFLVDAVSAAIGFAVVGATEWLLKRSREANAGAS